VLSSGWDEHSHAADVNELRGEEIAPYRQCSVVGVGITELVAL
jgi:hypothetical protein